MIIELFLEAGYPPGDYDLLVAFGARNQELRETAEGTRLDLPTKAAIEAHFLGDTRRFTRRSKDGEKTTWSLTTHELIPGPQSYAGFHLWHKRPNGMAAQDIVHLAYREAACFERGAGFEPATACLEGRVAQDRRSLGIDRLWKPIDRVSP